MQTRLVECRTGRKRISGAPLFTLVILYIFMKVDNITLMMFVLNFVEFCFILELIYSSDFHEGRQYFMLMLVLNFAF